MSLPAELQQAEREVNMPHKILIIDDDPYIVKYIEDILRDNGFVTCSASDGMEGLEVLKREKPDLVTLDLEMPNEWGPRFYRKMVKEAEFKNVPVIVVSGLPGIHLAIKNAVASFKKPFDPNKLLEAIRKTLEEGEGLPSDQTEEAHQDM